MEGGGDRDDVTMMIIAKIITDNEFEDFTDQILTKLKLAVNVRDDSDYSGYDEDCDGDNACDDGNDDVGDVEDGDMMTMMVVVVMMMMVLKMVMVLKMMTMMMLKMVVMMILTGNPPMTDC